jgi:hypothetical protein
MEISQEKLIEDRKEQRINEALAMIMDKLSSLEEIINIQTQRIDEMDSRLSIGDAARLQELQEIQQSLDAETSKSNASDSPSGSPRDKPKVDKRRKSIFIREAERSDATEVKKQVVIHVEPPSHKHIYLDSMELSDFTKFIIQWFEYEQINGIKLEPAQIISRRVRNLLM